MWSSDLVNTSSLGVAKTLGLTMSKTGTSPTDSHPPLTYMSDFCPAYLMLWRQSKVKHTWTESKCVPNPCAVILSTEPPGNLWSPPTHKKKMSFGCWVKWKREEDPYFCHSYNCNETMLNLLGKTLPPYYEILTKNEKVKKECQMVRDQILMTLFDPLFKLLT